MAEFTGISKKDHEQLTEAATVYRNLTGKDVSAIVSSIPTTNTVEEDAAADNARRQAELDAQAEMTAKIEAAQQEAREAAIAVAHGELPEGTPEGDTQSRKGDSQQAGKPGGPPVQASTRRPGVPPA